MVQWSLHIKVNFNERRHYRISIHFTYEKIIYNPFEKPVTLYLNESLNQKYIHDIIIHKKTTELIIT